MSKQSAAGLGLDIGTSFARAATLDQHGRPLLLGGAGASLPSLVRYTIAGPTLGHYAARYLVADYESTARDVVRYLGSWREIPAQLAAIAPYRVFEQGGRAAFDLVYSTPTAEEVYGLLAAQLAAGAAGPVVVTCPASASDSYRLSLCAAAHDAGVEVAQVINQPTAALLGLLGEVPTLGLLARKGGHVAVVDVGGGSSDVTIARLEGTSVQVVATAGEAHMGGVDFAHALAQAVNERFASQGVDLLGEAQAGSRPRLQAVALLRACEEVMEQLSTAQQADLCLDHGAGFGHDLWAVITRADLTQAVAPFMRRLQSLCGAALQQANLKSRQIGAVVLVGGVGQMPAVRHTVAAAFGQPLATLICRQQEAAVALGAAVQAGILSGRLHLSVRDVTPYPLGTACIYYAHTDKQQELFSTIIPRQQPIPTAAHSTGGAYTQRYYTLYPNQTTMRLDVLQYRGRKATSPTDDPPRVQPEECEKLADFNFTNLTPGQSAMVDVTFSIDASGILHVRACEVGTSNVLTTIVERWLGKATLAAASLWQAARR